VEQRRRGKEEASQQHPDEQRLDRRISAVAADTAMGTNHDDASKENGP